MTDTIKILESKGYIVIEQENMSMGKLIESCPVVYDILKPDYSDVYGANGIAPDKLNLWIDLPDLNEKETSKEAAPVAYTAKEMSERKIKEQEFDNLYNEGAEGYNPFRA